MRGFPKCKIKGLELGIVSQNRYIKHTWTESCFMKHGLSELEVCQKEFPKRGSTLFFFTRKHLCQLSICLNRLCLPCDSGYRPPRGQPTVCKSNLLWQEVTPPVHRSKRRRYGGSMYHISFTPASCVAQTGCKTCVL